MCKETHLFVKEMSRAKLCTRSDEVILGKDIIPQPANSLVELNSLLQSDTLVSGLDNSLQ